MILKIQNIYQMYRRGKDMFKKYEIGLFYRVRICKKRQTLSQMASYKSLLDN